MKVDRIRDAEDKVIGYKAYSKNFPDLAAAEGETQYHAIQSFHRRMQVYNQDGLEEANAADVSPKTKDSRTRN